MIPHLLVADPTVAPRVPVLQSRRLRGFGAVLRNHFPSDKETFLAIKASRIYSHHQPDEGAIHLFGRGVPIILDALHPDDPGSCYREDWHPIISFADGKTHRRGEVAEFRTSPLADFVAADIPVGPFLPGPPEPGMTARRQPTASAAGEIADARRARLLRAAGYRLRPRGQPAQPARLLRQAAARPGREGQLGAACRPSIRRTTAWPPT